VKLRRIELTGFIGWLFWGIAHIYFLNGIRNRLIVALAWLWNYVTYQRGARLIIFENLSVDSHQNEVAKAASESKVG
jgi:NADH dehydrogenase